MRASSWIAARPIALRAGSLVAVTLTLGACGDLPASGPASYRVRDGERFSANGTVEASFRPAGATADVVVRRAEWSAEATAERGVARLSTELRTSTGRAPTVRPDPGEPTDDGAARLLSGIATHLLPALAVDVNAPQARFGKASVVESTIKDSLGRDLQIIGVSKLERGPLTDFLLVQNGQLLTLQSVHWVRDGGHWRPASTRAVALGANGAMARTTVRVSGMRADAGTHDDDALASVVTRIESIQFASLAKRLVLPGALRAQDVTPKVDCTQYQNRFAGTDSPCLSYALNRVGMPLTTLWDWAKSAVVGVGMVDIAAALSTGGEVAVGTLLQGVATRLLILASWDWAAFVAASLVVYTVAELADCRIRRQDEVRECQRKQTRADGGGDPNSVGLVNDACGFACNPQRRGEIDDLIGGRRAAE